MNLRKRLAAISIGIVVIAVFGPYTVIPNVRTEQIAIYSSLLVALPLGWVNLRPSAHWLAVMIVWSIYAIVGIVATLWPVTTAIYAPGNTLAGIHHLLLPLAVLLLVELWLTSEIAPQRLLGIASRWTVLAMCINAALAFAMIFVDLTPVLSHFWSADVGDPATETVAGLAAQSGRFSGLVNQPAEAGGLYGIAVLASIYLFRDKPVRLAAAVLVLLVGGVLTVSKVFLLVGLPLALWQVLRSHRARRQRLTAIGASLVVAVVFTQLGIVPEWAGSGFLARLLEPSGGLLDFYTAGRIGESSTLKPIIDVVMNESPIVGMGAAGLVVPYDNGWIESLIYAGVVGVVAYTVTLAIMLHAWWVRRSVMTKPESMFGGGLVLLAVGASVGLAALTANRLATILWILTALTVLVSRRAYDHAPASRDLDSLASGPSRSGRLESSRPMMPTRIATRQVID